jgi:hypothetical protein
MFYDPVNGVQKRIKHKIIVKQTFNQFCMMKSLMHLNKRSSLIHVLFPLYSPIAVRCRHTFPFFVIAHRNILRVINYQPRNNSFTEEIKMKVLIRHPDRILLTAILINYCS